MSKITDQKPTQLGKAVILQLKIAFKNNKKKRSQITITNKIIMKTFEMLRVLLTCDTEARIEQIL